jgi:predicted DNA-binding protein
MTSNLVNISAHVPQSLAKKLEKVAKFEERPKSFYIKKSLEKYLQEKLEDIQDYVSARKTLKEAKAKGEKFYSMDEVFKD